MALWRPAPPWREPRAALAAALAVERALGRERRERWGPRRIDLDLLAWDPPTDAAAEAAARGRGPRPELPHPRALERAFVLLPWSEIAPGWVHPGPRRPLVDLAAAIDLTGVQALSEPEARRWAAAFGGLAGPW